MTDFSTLAFTLGTPQKAPTDEQFEDLGGKVFQTPTLGQLALLRKLHFEATTLMVASINEQVKTDTSDPTSLAKRLPAAEKQSRLEIQMKRLTGLKIAGELAPSHQLLDVTNAMVESGVLTWIAPSKCSKRDDEIQANIKPAASTLQIEQSTLRVAQVPVATTADVGDAGNGPMQAFGLGLSRGMGAVASPNLNQRCTSRICCGQTGPALTSRQRALDHLSTTAIQSL